MSKITNRFLYTAFFSCEGGAWVQSLTP